MLDIGKIKRLESIIEKNNVDGYLMGAHFDLKYLSGIDVFPDERFKGLLVLKDGKRIFISPELYYEDFKNTLGEDVEMYVWGDGEGVNSTFKKIKNKYGLEGLTIAIDDRIRGIDLLDMTEIIKANFVHKPNISKDLRIIKDSSEIKHLQDAATIADRAYEEILKFIKPGLTEKEISDKLKKLLIELGGEALSFEPIVASGPNSSMPHYSGNARIIEDQDLIILDFGCVYKGYCSDMSRTVFVGKPTQKQRKIYEIVLKANSDAEAAAKEGATAEEIDKIARDVIKNAGYGQYFINRTGHGIGVEVHEHPFIKEGNSDVLKSGMAFSIEPGIYIPKEFGMRVEDIVIINKDNPIILNKSTKELIIV